MARPKKEEVKEKLTGGLMSRLKQASKCEFAEVMSEYENIEPREFVDTGNILFNCLLSADPYKGFPVGKIMTLAGPPGCGKSFSALEIVKNAQKLGYSVILYDSEMANNNKESLTLRGIDIERLLYIPIGTIEELKTSLLNIFEELSEDDKVIIMIDSLSNLSSAKEIEDSKNANDKKDLTKQSLMKALFRTITLPAAIKQVGIVCISHVYQSLGSFIPQSIISGGEGIKYMSSILVQMTKAQDKDGNETIGALITAKTDKNRFAKERSKVKYNINFNTGLQRYAGLAEFFEEEKFFKKDGRGYVYDGVKYTQNELTNEFWETQLHGKLGDYLKNKFKYMSSTEDILNDIEEEE